MVMRVMSGNLSNIEKSIIYALDKHHGVHRKGKNIPYILHPVEVMSIVASITDDEDVIAAGALHDVIEDTDTTYDDIKKEFNKRIANIVAAESQNLLPGYREDMSWKEIKELAFNHLKTECLDVKIVALADKLSNIRAIHNDMLKYGNRVWSIFNERDPRIHKWRYNELLKCFSELEYTHIYEEFKFLVEDTFKGID